VTYTWRAAFEHGPEPFEVRAQGTPVRDTVRVRDDDQLAYAFGEKLAEASGWPPEPDEPFVEVT
jgi:hypothetical protein